MAATHPAALMRRLEASPHWHRMRPGPRPETSDPVELAAWIEAARSAAFLCGARHDEISLAEAVLTCEGARTRETEGR